MRNPSPLRYPGGKARLFAFLAKTIKLNSLGVCDYYEPYAGGAGAALALLLAGKVVGLHLNDADRRIFSFWRSVLDDTDRFAERILNVPLTVKEWRVQNEICTKPRGRSRFELGFAAFYMNRCNRSGIITGAGPIGGYKQDGPWKMDVRFNRLDLAERVRTIGAKSALIQVSCQDAITFLKAKLPLGNDRAKVFVYLDPPYVGNGQRLYLNYYEAKEHRTLSRYMRQQSKLKWLMSYDDDDLVRHLYPTCTISTVPIAYSLQVKRSAHELAIVPNGFSLPKGFHAFKKAKLTSPRKRKTVKPHL
jgi:DNA adenine methylase